MAAVKRSTHTVTAKFSNTRTPLLLKIHPLFVIKCESCLIFSIVFVTRSTFRLKLATAHEVYAFPAHIDKQRGLKLKRTDLHLKRQVEQAYLYELRSLSAVGEASAKSTMTPYEFLAVKGTRVTSLSS